MKKVLLALLIFTALVSVTSKPGNSFDLKWEGVTMQSDYCHGWADGFCEGWRDVKGQLALCPVTPLCPVALLGQDRYKDGYNRGFKAGSIAAKK